MSAINNDKYSVEISALDEDGQYIEESDIQFPLFNTKKEAENFAKGIDFQDPSKYEINIYQLNESGEIIESWNFSKKAGE